MTLSVFPSLPGITYTSVKTAVFDTLINRAPNAYETRLPQTINPVYDWTLIYDFLHDFQWGDNTSSFRLITELRQLQGFFEQMMGKANAFLYLDPDDNAVGPALLTTAWQANTFYFAGQGILDPSNHWQQCIQTGESGSSTPGWNDLGGTTNDGGVIWHDMGAGYSAGFPNTFLAGLPIVNDGLGHYYSPIQRTLNGYAFIDITDLNGSIAVYSNGVLQVGGTYSSGGAYSIAGPGLALPTSGYMGLYIAWNNPPAWAHTTYATNAIILDPAGHIQKATTGGTTGATIPVFNDSGGTTTDGGVTWTDQGYNPGIVNMAGEVISNISAAFNFYWRVRFDTDSQDFEKFLGIGNAAAKILANAGGGYWTIGGSNSQQGTGTLRMTSARPQPL